MPPKKVWTSPSLHHAHLDDIIIPILGLTGVGKSQFINHIAGEGAVPIGHGLESSTKQLLPVIIDPSSSSQSRLLNGRRLVVVDTPGFDDTGVDDFSTLSKIGTWLAATYSADVKLAGVVYIHDISLARMHGSTRRSIELLQGLCGDVALQRVVLCTTKWLDTNEGDGERRSQELRNGYWKEMITHGSTVHKFGDSPESAWEVVNLIIEKREVTEVLQIQKELVDVHKFIPDTEAGRTLKYSLHELQNSLKTRSKEDPSQREKLDTQISYIRKEIKAMHIPVTKRVSAFFTTTIDIMLDKFSLISWDTYTPSDDIRPYVLRKNETLRDTDIVIAVVAVTGTGKSRFINNCTGGLLQENDGVHSGSDVEAVVIPEPVGLVGYRLVLVEMPGCNQVKLSDDEIIICIEKWLQRKCRPQYRYSGIIFLQDLGRRAKRGTSFLEKMVGRPCAQGKPLVLTTVRREKSQQNPGGKGEMPTEWTDLVKKGATKFHLEDTAQSALQLVKTIIEQASKRGREAGTGGGVVQN